DAGVALVTVPVRVIAGDLQQRLRHVLRRRLGLLQADHVGLLAIDPPHHLGGASADAVDVPGRDLHAAQRFFGLPALPVGTPRATISPATCDSSGSRSSMRCAVISARPRSSSPTTSAITGCARGLANPRYACASPSTST